MNGYLTTDLLPGGDQFLFPRLSLAFDKEPTCEQIVTRILGPILLQRTRRLITFVWGLWSSALTLKLAAFRSSLLAGLATLVPPTGRRFSSTRSMDIRLNP